MTPPRPVVVGPLVRGHGPGPEDGGCIWDRTIYNAGLGWADRHPCFSPVLIRAGQYVNDRLTPAGLARLECFEPRLARARRALDPAVEIRIQRRLALWAARRVEHLSPAASRCNAATAAYLDGRLSREDLLAVSRKVRRVAAVVAVVAAEAAAAAAVAVAAAAAAAVAVAAVDDALLAYLDELLDEWEKIAADEGGLGFLDDPANYTAVVGS